MSLNLPGKQRGGHNPSSYTGPGKPSPKMTLPVKNRGLGKTGCIRGATHKNLAVKNPHYIHIYTYIQASEKGTRTYRVQCIKQGELFPH